MSSFSPIQTIPRGFAATLIPAASAAPRAAEVEVEEVEDTGPVTHTPEELAEHVAAAEARGREAARAEVAAELAAMSEKVALAGELVGQLDAAAAAQAEEARAQVGPLILEVLQRLVGELEVFQDLSLSHAFGEVAGRMVGEREVVVRVCPAQVSLAKSLIVDRPGWTVRKDPAIKAGLRIETERGRVDATLGAALENIEAAVEAWQSEREL